MYDASASQKWNEQVREELGRLDLPVVELGESPVLATIAVKVGDVTGLHALITATEPRAVAWRLGRSQPLMDWEEAEEYEEDPDLDCDLTLPELTAVVIGRFGALGIRCGWVEDDRPRPLRDVEREMAEQDVRAAAARSAVAEAVERVRGLDLANLRHDIDGLHELIGREVSQLTDGAVRWSNRAAADELRRSLQVAHRLAWHEQADEICRELIAKDPRLTGADRTTRVYVITEHLKSLDPWCANQEAAGMIATAMGTLVRRDARAAKARAMLPIGEEG